jgi:hypothetical protein
MPGFAPANIDSDQKYKFEVRATHAHTVSGSTTSFESAAHHHEHVRLSTQVQDVTNELPRRDDNGAFGAV